ncbi:hypothetical protein ACLOJK_007036 [Asimina triloba]
MINACSVDCQCGLLATHHAAADVADVADLSSMCRREGEEGTGGRRAMLMLVLAVDSVDEGGRLMEGDAGGERSTLLMKMGSVRSIDGEGS